MQLQPPRRIWTPWTGEESVRTFRRRFDASEPCTGVLRACSSGEARASIDGAHVELSGPSLPPWRVFRTAEVAIAAGEHEVALEVQPGPHAQPFVLASLDWSDERLVTDESWDVDGARAWECGGVWCEPWGMPCDAPVDHCRLSTGWQAVQSETLRERVEIRHGLASKGGRARVTDGHVELRVPEPHALRPPVLPEELPEETWYRSRELHSRVTNKWLELFEARAPRATFDLGAETFARANVRLVAGGPALVGVLSAESRGELERYAARVADVVELRDGETFSTCPTGLRYLAILGLAHTGEALVLEPPVVDHVRYPVERAGSFACSDPRLDAIWDLGARTVHLCMQNELWDGIRRDQLPWMGDLYVEALAAYHAFGEQRLTRRTLALLGDLAPGGETSLTEQRYPGLVRAWTTDEADINGIPSYTMWWLVGLDDHLRYTGDTSLVYELAPTIESVVDHVTSWVDPDGSWRHRSGWDFVDWSPLDREERERFCHLLAAYALGRAERLCADPSRARDTRARLLDVARAWGPEELAARHQLAAMAILAGVFEGEDARVLFRSALAEDPPQRMTYWHRYSDLEAARLVGEVEWGLEVVRRHWGGSLELGATALWEAFEHEWLDADDPHAVSVIGPDHARYGGYETSLCHGWSAGPTVWLHRAVLGVEVLDADTIRFAPDLGRLDHARGTVPTARGPVDVELDGRVARLAHPHDLCVVVDEKAGEQFELSLEGT